MLGLRPFTHSTSPETCAFDGRPPQLDGRVVTFELRRAARGDALAVRSISVLNAGNGDNCIYSAL